MIRAIDIQATAMSEDALQTHVITAARTFGWRATHFRPARTGRKDAKGREIWTTPLQGDSGFPDLVLARNGRVLCVELKSHRGRPDENQKLWAQEMGESYRLWRPLDWLTGVIEKELMP